MKKNNVLLFSIIILTVLLFGNLNSSAIIVNDLEGKNSSFQIVTYDDGWVEEQNGIKIAHLKGSFYDMGYQYGYLLKYELLKGVRAKATLLPLFNLTYEEIKEFWNIQKNYMRQETIDYIQGTADAIGLDIEDYGWIWLIQGAAYYKMSPDADHCSSFAAWGNATRSGELIQIRMLDGPPEAKDPITGELLISTPVLVVADPDEGHAFAYPTFAGYCAEDGFNEMGISVTYMWSRNHGNKSVKGAPIGTRMLETLYSATTIDEALDIMTSNKTYGYNMVVADSKIPIAYAIETTGNLSYSGTWNDTTESLAPFWEIEHVVRRVCLFINETLSETQREIYNPKALRYIMSCFNIAPRLRRLLGINEDFGVYQRFARYNSLSKGVEENWGQIDLENAMQITKNVYNGGYDLAWKLICTKQKYWESWWHWAVCPKTGDFFISYRTPEHLAYENPVNEFNLFEMLNSSPS